MKRLQDRDSPPPPKSVKRSRGGTSSSTFADGGDGGPRSPGASSSGSKPSSGRRAGHGTSSSKHTVVRGGSGSPTNHRLLVGLDYHPASSRGRGSSTSIYDKEYRILCVSGINHRVSDVSVRDGVFREFKKYGDIDVKLAADGPERFAYVYFRTSEEARDARHSKAKLILFDKPVLVEPIFEAPMPVHHHHPIERRSRRQSISPDLVGVPGYINKMSRAARGLSPAHSASSSSSLQRRRSSMDRLGPPIPMHHLTPLHHHHHGHHHNHDGPPFRREMTSVPPIPHPDFLAPHGLPPGAALRRSTNNNSMGAAAGSIDDLKKEKFPNYLHHIPPEEDDKANRTLFVGNLEVNIGEPELRRIFERYGVVEDVDIKRPPPGQGNAYAFVKFLNLDMAHKSKVEMSGQYIGKFQCKIGYGKPVPTTRIWVGGLGPWTSLSHLEKEFDRFGAIKKIDFVKGDNHAYILYDSIDAAQEACKEMRGFPLGGPKKRLRVDFADTGAYNFGQPGAATAVAAVAVTRQPPAATYPVDDDPYYRRRVETEHPSLRGHSSDPYHYYGNNRDPEYATRWPRGAAGTAATTSGSFGPDYDPYYERTPRSRIDDDWAASGGGAGYERGERNHDFTNWGRDYPSWRDGGSAPGIGRDWGVGSDGQQPRRKRPRTPDFDGLPPTRGGQGDGLSYRRPYPRQRSPSDAAIDAATIVSRGRRRTPPSPSLQQRGYRAREPREHEMSPGWRSSQQGRERGGRRASSRSPDADKSDRSKQGVKMEIQDENGRNPTAAAAATVTSTSSPPPPPATSPGGSLLLPEGHTERLVNASSLSEVARLLPCTWHGGLVLKSSYFPIRMYACEGNVKLVESLTKDGEAGAVLRITQRLRLDQPKLDDVSKRLSGGNFCILLGMASLNAGDVTEQARTLAGGQNVQQRPLRNLVSYLKQKEAAGVIALTSGGGKETQGVLYAFPPCQFSQERLQSVAPRLGDDGLKDDHLIVAVVKGGI